MSDTAVKPGKKVVESVYVTGFCTIGNHEATNNLSPSGAKMKACALGGRFDAGKLGIIVCTCSCHEMSREMENITGIQLPAAIINRTTPSLGRILRESGGSGRMSGKDGTDDLTAPSVVVASGARFSATPTGRAARGQLEEQVRHYVSLQVKMAGEETIAFLGLTPQTLGVMINKEAPPSNGAIYSVLKRWEGSGLVELSEKPFRFVRFTDAGKRQIFHA